MIAASATAASLLPCPLVPVPTAAAALVETEKGVVFSQRGGPPPSLPLVPHSLGASKVQLSVLACAVRSAGAGVGRGLRCSLRFSHDRMAEVPPPPLRVTRFALRHCTTSTSHPPLPLSPLSLPTTTRRRSPEFPFPSSHHFRSLRRFSWPSSFSSLAAVDKLFPRRPPDCGGGTAVWK